MLTTLKRWWYQEDVCSKEPDLELAMTKLMVGMMAMDGTLHPSQHEEITTLLHSRFGMPTQESDMLIQQTLDEGDRELSFNQTVKYIKSNYTIEERADMLAQIWIVAIVDGHVDFLEEQYINRLAALLAVPTARLSELKATQEQLFIESNQKELLKTQGV